MPGTCHDRSVQTALSYAVAVVSITSDWIFAILPIFLLWNVQLDWRVKCSVIGMLGLGILYAVESRSVFSFVLTIIVHQSPLLFVLSS